MPRIDNAPAAVLASRRSLRPWLVKTLTLALTLPAANAVAESPVDGFLKSVTGRPLYLKVDVVRVQWVLGGQDATNLDHQGQVYYRAFVGGFRSVTTTSPREFATEVRVQTRKRDQTGVTMRSWNKGTAAVITKAKADKDEVELELQVTEGEPKIRFKFEGPYDISGVERCFHAAFAESEAELQGAAATTDIKAGMSPDEVIAAKGAPKTRVDLGLKTILAYPDMKLVFEGGKLVDVQ